MICLGVILYYISPFIIDVVSLMDDINSFGYMMSGGSYSSASDVFGYLLESLVPIGAVIFFMGLKEFRNAVDKADEANVTKISNAVIILFIGSVMDFLPIPFLGIIVGIINIIAVVMMLMAFSALKSSQTFLEGARKGASILHVSMFMIIVVILVGWIPFIGGVIGSILTFIAYFIAAFGWKIIAEAGRGAKNGAGVLVYVDKGDNSPRSYDLSDEGQVCYREADGKTNEEIDSILGGSTAMLNPMFVEALKDIKKRRVEIAKINESKKVFYNEAITKSGEEVDHLLVNATTLNPLYVCALNYLKICRSLEEESSFEGFLRTLEPNYIAPKIIKEKPVEAEVEEDVEPGFKDLICPFETNYVVSEVEEEEPIEEVKVLSDDEVQTNKKGEAIVQIIGVVILLAGLVLLIKYF